MCLSAVVIHLHNVATGLCYQLNLSSILITWRVFGLLRHCRLLLHKPLIRLLDLFVFFSVLHNHKGLLQPLL